MAFTPLFTGHRPTCVVCCGEWGKCTCKIDHPDDPDSHFEDHEGFTFEGFFITDPRVTECGRFYVDPDVYYGEAYITWRDSQGRKG